MAEALTFTLKATDNNVLKTLQALATHVKSAETAVTRLLPAFAGTTTASTQAASAVARVGTTATVVTAAMRQTTDAANAVARSLRGVSDDADKASGGLGGMLKQGLATAAGLLGLHSVGAAIKGVVGSMVGFESAMGNVNTLVAGNVPLQAKLRAELLQLPPVLGSSTQLAEGLYAALSAGVEPAKAVAFVGEAAKTAKAGLTDMETSVNTLASVLVAYEMKTTEVTKVSDLLFQTVNVGKGKFGEFAGAFSLVSPLAHTLGISLQEVSATLGTLSFAFPSAQAGATGLRSMMSNLIQHMGDFRAIGIDVKQVIAEEGLTGLMKKLAAATGGNIEQIRALIPDVEGLSAVLALTGAQAGAQAKNLTAMATATGSTGKAFVEQTKGMGSAWDQFKNSLDRLYQETAPPVLGALKSIADALTTTTQAFQTSSIVTMTIAPILQGINEALQGMSVPLRFLESQWITLNIGFNKVVSGLLAGVAVMNEALAKLYTAAGTASKALGFDTVGDKLLTAGANMTKAAATARALADAATATGEEWRSQFDRMAQSTAALVPPVTTAGTTTEKFTMEVAKAKDALAATAAAATQVGDKTPAAIDKAKASVETLPPAAERATRAIELIWENGVARIVETYGALPEALAPVDEAIVAGTGATTTEVTRTWQETHAAVMTSYDGVEKAILAINEATGRGIQASAEKTKQAVEVVVQSAAERISALSQFMQTTLGSWKGFDTPFADTETGIQDQIRGFQESIANLKEPGMHHSIPGYVTWQLAEWNKAIVLLYQKLAGIVAQKNTDLMAGVRTTTTTLGGGGSGSGGLGGSARSASSAGGTAGTTDAALMAERLLTLEAVRATDARLVASIHDDPILWRQWGKTEAMIQAHLHDLHQALERTRWDLLVAERMAGLGNSWDDPRRVDGLVSHTGAPGAGLTPGPTITGPAAPTAPVPVVIVGPGGGTGGPTSTPTGPIDYDYGLPGMARGGLVPGSGPADSRMARVSPGEFLLPPREVSQLMGMLREAIPARHGAQASVTHVYNIDVRYTGTQNARQLANDLKAELRELQRRGEL